MKILTKSAGLSGLCVALAMLLSACSSPGGVQDSAPRRTPAHLDRLPDPVVRDLPRSRSGNRSPYTVLGKSYTILPSAEGYRVNGNASWYGAKFHGRLTSSGERYNMYSLTAAHKSLPIPCFARVTNLDNGRTTIVRVNDRGPFHSDRVIDLSYAAAIKLGFASKGTARVKVEVVTATSARGAQVRKVAARPVVKTVPRAVARPQATQPKSLPKPIYLQAGAFKDQSAAATIQAKLAKLVGALVQVIGSADGLYRVSIGPVAHLREAQRIQSLMESANFVRPLILRR